MDEERVLAFPRAPDAIELRHLRSFVAVAEELNFGRAAEQLYLSQPALSRQIRALEQFVGVELFRRSTHQVELTLAGEALLDRARSILRGVDEAVSVTQSVGGELVGRSMGMWKALADLSDAGADVHAMRDAYEALHAQFAPPPEVTVRPVSAGGVSSLLVSPPDQPRASLLYLHGGGYMLGSAFGYRHLAGALALAADAGALVAGLPARSRAPVPRRLDDALSAYRWLLDRGQDRRSWSPATPRAAASRSRCCSRSSATGCRSRPAPCCSARRRPPRSPKSPAERRGLPRRPSAGGPDREPLTADLAASRRCWSRSPRRRVVRRRPGARRRASEHGVDARLELYPVATHVFQVFSSFLPEASEAIESAAALRRRGPRGSAIGPPGRGCGMGTILTSPRFRTLDLRRSSG